MVRRINSLVSFSEWIQSVIVIIVFILSEWVDGLIFDLRSLLRCLTDCLRSLLRRPFIIIFSKRIHRFIIIIAERILAGFSLWRSGWASAGVGWRSLVDHRRQMFQRTADFRPARLPSRCSARDAGGGRRRHRHGRSRNPYGITCLKVGCSIAFLQSVSGLWGRSRRYGGSCFLSCRNRFYVAESTFGHVRSAWRTFFMNSEPTFIGESLRRNMDFG